MHHLIGAGSILPSLPDLNVRIHRFDLNILDWPPGQLIPDIRLDLQLDFHFGFDFL